MTPVPPNDLAQDLSLLRGAAVNAGIMAMGYFRRDVKTWTKQNSSPVSEADYLVDEFLGEILTASRPDYGWLSEETADNEDRLSRQRVFVVDPIDGTRGFLRGEDGWSIALSVVENGKPIVGVVYAPARDELYEATLGGGAKLNSAPLVTHPHPGPLPIIPGPGAVHNELQAMGLDYLRGPALPSLAHRLLQVGTGVLDVALSRRGAQDWDIAAADIILSECGYLLEDVCLGRPVYNKADVRHGAIAVMRNPDLRDKVHTALRTVYGCPNPQPDP